MTYVEGAGGVNADKFQLYPGTFSNFYISIGFTILEDNLRLLCQPVAGRGVLLLNGSRPSVRT